MIHAITNDSWKGGFSYKAKIKELTSSSKMETQLLSQLQTWMKKQNEALIGSEQDYARHIMMDLVHCLRIGKPCISLSMENQMDRLLSKE